MKTLYTLILILFANIAFAEMSSFADIIEKASPAVVNISTTQKISNKGMALDNPMDLFDFFEKEFGRELGLPERKRKTKSLGSGFVIDSDGYIVTNYHVVEDAEQIEVTLSDGTEKVYDGKVIGKDKKTDLALIKINAHKPLAHLMFGNSDEARVGDRVIAIGSPFGLSSTATSGIVSAKARYLAGQFDEYIQTDAAINRGNSGGPMLNIRGEVIGINTVILSPSGGSVGIGFAVPSNLGQSVIMQLKSKGEVVRGWLGVRIQPVTEEIAITMGFKEQGGALVAEVTPGSPAAKGGIEVGDIITKFNNVPVENNQKLSKTVASTPVNQAVTVEVFRNKSTKTLSFILGRLEHDSDETDENADSDEYSEGEVKGTVLILDMRLKNIDDVARKRYRIVDGINGALVASVGQKGAAAKAKINAGDVIIQVNQDKVNSAQDFKDKIMLLKKQKNKTAALLIANSLGAYFVVVSLE